MIAQLVAQVQSGSDAIGAQLPEFITALCTRLQASLRRPVDLAVCKSTLYLADTLCDSPLLGKLESQPAQLKSFMLELFEQMHNPVLGEFDSDTCHMMLRTINELSLKILKPREPRASSCTLRTLYSRRSTLR